ncbi:MAG: N-acetyl-gamma-glutamyl-phosphate reductase [Candidatus Spyradocola sp.]|jgi:N-acetyl-gamma-glutamyl-phosphate reductase
MIKASIVGATGYVGVELVRLLAQHPAVEIAYLSSQSHEGEEISALYPSLMGTVQKELAALDPEKFAKESDVVFTSLPHGASGEVIPRLYEAGTRVIDMSGDFRYDDVKTYEAWYGVTHARPDLLDVSVYGLTELHREEIRGARLIGNPGCYTTCSILAAAPLLRAGLVSAQNIIIDAKSGVTGAGAKPTQGSHFCEVDESLKAYNVARHRHTSEIEQELTKAAGETVLVSFTPHLVPIKRGILSTVYLNLNKGVGEAEIRAAYEKAYAGEPFVTLMPAGKLPEVKYVTGSNRCAIGFVVDERLGRVVVCSVLDNLLKGAAGQAVQNMNLLFGLPETTGLPVAALCP